jgi:hypothetical protein
MGIPFYQLNYPPTLTDERARDYHRQDFKGLISFLEGQTGSKLDIDKLREVVTEIEKQTALINEFTEFQRLIPSPVPSIFNLFLFSGNFLLGGTKDYTDLLQSMLKKVKENAARGIAGTSSGKERMRSFFSYIDHYTTDLRLWKFLDQNEISHLGCILSTFWGEGASYSTERPDAVFKIKKDTLDDLINSLACQVSRMPMVKSVRGPYDAPNMWLDDTLLMTKVMKADFVVYFGSMGCRNTWGMVKSYARDLERQGIPTLIMYADAFDDRVQSWESVTDKMSEFIHLRGLAT